MGVLAVSVVVGLHFADGRCVGAIKGGAILLSIVAGGQRHLRFLVTPQSVGPPVALSDLARRVAALE